MAAYKSYRLNITGNTGSAGGYVTINEWQMFESEDASSPNVLSGGVASASSSYNATTQPDKAFDDGTETYWESSNIGLPHWLQYDLPEAVEVRSIYILAKRYPSEKPRSFKLLGSNDGTTWESVCVFIDVFSDGDTTPASNELRSSLVRELSGISLLDDGTAVELIRIFDWDTGKLIHSLVPGADGHWKVSLADTKDVLVVQYPTVGYRPQADGPIVVRSKW